MFNDARQIPAGTVLDAEICIVGAGAAGISLALSLRDRGMRVLLLESGGMELDEATQALYAGESRGVPNHDLDASRLRYFGGTTNHWAGWCRRLEATDFRPPNPGDLRGWPITRDDLAPHYATAQALCEVAPGDDDDAATWPAGPGMQALPLDPARLRTALFRVSPPTRFAAAYGEALARTRNIAVTLHANVLEVQTDAQATRVIGLRVRALTGPEFAVTARFFVLAAGGLENARLLLLSNRAQQAGLGNGHDVVGRYFMDHPWLTDAGFIAFTRPSPGLALYLDEPASSGSTMFGALAQGAPEPGIGGFRVVLHPARRVVEGVDALKSIAGDVAALRLPDRLWHKLGRVAADYDAVVDSAYKTLFGTRKSIFGSPEAGAGPILGAHLDINVEQLPDPASRVLLSASRDALGQRRLVLDWRPGEAEKRTMRRAVELVGLEFGRLGLGRLRAKPLAEGSHWPADMQGSRHHMGTTRMSVTPRTGVVDAECRVHGVTNLYMAGSSVFASCGFANPTLTIVALALRLGDRLAREFG